MAWGRAPDHLLTWIWSTARLASRALLVGSNFCVTQICLCFSAIFSLRNRSFSSRTRISTSPLSFNFSWIFIFSKKMHTSSSRSMSWTPLWSNSEQGSKWVLRPLFPRYCGSLWLWAHLYINTAEFQKTGRHRLPVKWPTPDFPGVKRVLESPFQGQLGSRTATVAW